MFLIHYLFNKLKPLPFLEFYSVLIIVSAACSIIGDVFMVFGHIHDLEAIGLL